jgi:hypothetical protein
MKPDDATGCVFLNAQGVVDPVHGDIPSLGCLAQVIVRVINFTLMFLEAVLVIMILWGAVRFITSTGDPKAIESARKTITYAIIGAVIVALSFVLVNLVTTALGLPNILTQFSFYQ